MFRHVVLPLSAPGALLGLLLTFVLTVGSFVTPKLLGGGRVPLVATEIQDQAAVTLDWPVAAVLSLLTLLLFGTAGRRLWRRRPADRGGGAMTGAILRVLHGLLVAALRALLPGVEEAAASLGARPMSVALRITLPLAAPGLAAAGFRAGPQGHALRIAGAF